MNNKRIKYIALGLLSQFGITTNILGQENIEFPLRVGSKMPEILFHTMVNYPGGKAKLSDFAGKSVILDLWHVKCSACIADMPKMQELYRKFDGKVQIIGFGLNNLNDYKKLRRTSSILKTITSLPLALQADTPLFNNLVGYYPTHIWIDGSGIIRAITQHYNATEKNIQNLIDGKTLSFIMDKPNSRSDTYYPSDSSILVQGNGENLKTLQYYSVFSKRVDFNDSQNQYLSVGPVEPGIKIINASLINLIYQAWTSDKILESKVVLESESLKSRLLVPINDDERNEWYQNNIFCYELRLAEGKTYSKEIMIEYLRQDIQRFFGIKIDVKPYLTNCLILYRIGGKDLIKSKGISQNNNYDSGMTNGLDFKNVSMSKILYSIQRKLAGENLRGLIKVIDETGYKGSVDMKFDHKLTDINLVRASLKKYGLGLKEENRVVDCIVISKAD